MFGLSKKCTRCNEIKPLSEFSNYKHSKDGKKAGCKACQKLYNDKWFAVNRDKKADSNRWWMIGNKYNLTKDQYLEMLEQQNHCCKICYKHQDENTHGSLYVDHCHSTNAIRGLLCRSCNSMLGMVKDNIDILTNAINYLKETNEKSSNL